MSRPILLSMEPLDDENIVGFVLRVAHRNDRSPAWLIKRTGIGTRELGSRRVLQLPGDLAESFARVCRLETEEAGRLTFLGAYGDLVDRLGMRSDLTRRSRWTLWFDVRSTRYCPDCLRTDDPAGPCWRSEWRKPWKVACLAHGRMLEDRCPECGCRVGDQILAPGASAIASASLAGLPVDACRARASGEPPCGRRLADDAAAGSVVPPWLLHTQARLDAIIEGESGRPTVGGEPVDLGVWYAAFHAVEVLVRASTGLPGAPDLGAPLEPFAGQLRAAADDTRTLRLLRPANSPSSVSAAAAIAHEALGILEARDLGELGESLARFREPVKAGRPGFHELWRPRPAVRRALDLDRAPGRWFALTSSVCSSPYAGTLEGRQLPQVVPSPHRALLEPFTEVGTHPRSLDRATALLLWQYVERNPSIQEAAAAMQTGTVNVAGKSIAELDQRLTALNLLNAYTRTLHTLADAIALDPPVDYVRRRAVLADWAMPDGAWDILKAEMSGLLPATKTFDWALRRAHCEQYVWVLMTGSDPYNGPLCRNTPTGTTPSPALAVQLQFARRVAEGRVPIHQLLADYARSVLEAVDA